MTKWLFIEEVFYMFVHWTIKQAFLFFYLRLSPDQRFRRVVYATMLLNTLFTIANWLIAFLQCKPFKAAIYKSSYPNAKCIDPYVLNMLPTGLNIITDLIILTLPIPTVLALQMSAKRKAAVLGVICFGATAVITAFCRFEVQRQLITDPDTPYVLGRMIIVAAIEIEVAVVAVNLPAMRSLFTKLVGSSGGDEVYPSSHELPSGNKRSSRQKNGAFRLSQRGGGVTGATLTESEEELIRREGGSSIKITTDVDVSSAVRYIDYI
ncbi:hypothetical protein MW887_004622 [Aspergillus wentii]|nr:hypothetical protein MW887_004622 [Aspergillus wentii]